MALDINRNNIGVLCRDFGFLPQVTQGFRRIEVKFANNHQRKGNDNYVKALTEQLREWCPTWFDEIVVVGDGEGDVRFCINFENFSHNANPPHKVRGLFIAHSALERFQHDSPNIAFYGSWEELSEALAAVLSSMNRSDGSLGRTLVLVDVDRTILFPRLSHDDKFAKIRINGITDYVLGFRLPDNADKPEEKIKRFAEFASRNLLEYTNELNELCFKNEEVVAVVTLLLSVGTVIEKWVDRSNHRPLLDMIRQSTRRLKYGGWISGLDSEMLEQKSYVAGEAKWNRESLINHLTSVQESYGQNKPVLCPQFRLHESKHLSEFVAKHGPDILNLPLLEAMRSAMPLPLLFVTDRPAISLGFDPDSLGEDLGGGVFWAELRRRLYGESTANPRT